MSQASFACLFYLPFEGLDPLAEGLDDVGYVVGVPLVRPVEDSPLQSAPLVAIALFSHRGVNFVPSGTMLISMTLIIAKIANISGLGRGVNAEHGSLVEIRASQVVVEQVVVVMEQLLHPVIPSIVGVEEV